MKKLFLLAAVSATLLVACQKDLGEASLPQPNPNYFVEGDFNDYVNRLGIPENEPESEPEVVNVTQELISDTITCEVTTITASPGHNEILLMNPQTEYWLGAIFKGESILDGSHTQIISDYRALLTLSTSLPNLAGDVSITVDNPSLSTVREAIQELLNQNITGDTPAQISFEVKQFSSTEQLKLHIGAEFDGFGVEIAGSYDTGFSMEKNYHLVRFTQVYYSLDMDQPAEPDDLFLAGEYPDAQQIGNWSPVYISSIKYGRQAFFVVESEESAESVRAALNASFNFFVSGSAEITSEQESTLSSSSIRAYIYGGSGYTGSLAVNGYGGLEQYITEGGNWGPNSPGLPIAYTMRFLKDNSIYRIVISSEYTIRECEVLPEPEPTVVEFLPEPLLFLCPWHIGGDRDFASNGPVCNIETELILVGGKEIHLKVRYHLIETESDWTEGLYEGNHLLYTAEPGKVINQIIGSQSHSMEYTDTDDYFDTFDIANSFIAQYVANGDTSGNDIENCEQYPESSSQLNIHFNPISIEVVEE